MERIKRVIDKYFDFTDKIGGNSFIKDLVPNAMINDTKEPKFKGTVFWNAISSTIHDEEINQLEYYFGHQLPETYISFLKYRHYIELVLGEDSVAFFRNIPGQLVQDVKREVQNNFVYLKERSFIPFATLSDYGVLCFDANQSDSKDYPVVSFEHEDGYEDAVPYAKNFESMFYEFEDKLDSWIDNKSQN